MDKGYTFFGGEGGGYQSRFYEILHYCPILFWFFLFLEHHINAGVISLLF